jgi:hypothetical protein
MKSLNSFGLPGPNNLLPVPTMFLSGADFATKMGNVDLDILSGPAAQNIGHEENQALKV